MKRLLNYKTQYKIMKLKKENMEKQYNENLDNAGLFWAFSKEQFDENKIPKNENKNFISLGCGGYCHKSNLEKVKKAYKSLDILKREFINSININSLIEYELINHECWYTGDWYQIVDLIKSYNIKLSDETITKLVKNMYYRHTERFDW